MLKRLFSRHISGEVRPMLALATPIILAEIGWMTMSIVDTMMVGRQADSSVAIAAVSLGGILYNAVAIFGTGLMLGLDTVVSHSYGAGDLDDAHRSLVNGVYLSLCMAPVAMGIIHLLELPMHSIGTDPAVLAQAVPYLRAVNWSSLPLLLYFVFRRYLQGIDLAKPVMFSLISANLINLAGNWALIYGHLGFHAMGTVGSGWSTCVARIYMASFLMVYCLYYDLRYKMGLLNASRWPNFPRVWKLVTLGFPAAAQLGLEVAVFVVVTALIARLGAVALASHQIALNTVSFTYMIPLGLGGAAAVRVGQAFGRRDPHAASRAGWTAMLLGAIFMTCMALILWLLPAYIVRIYTPDPRGDPRRDKTSLRRRILPALRRPAGRRHRRPAWRRRHAHAHDSLRVHLLAHRRAARRVPVLPAQLGGVGPLVRPLHLANPDRECPGLRLAPQVAFLRSSRRSPSPVSPP